MAVVVAGEIREAALTSDSDPPITQIETLKLAIAEFGEQEKNRATFDSQVRNLAWLLITVATFAYFGLQTPALGGIYIYLAGLNWIAGAGVGVAVAISTFNTSRAFLSKKYTDPPSLAESRIWERQLREHAAQHGGGTDEIDSPNKQAMNYLLSTYAACAARNKQINDGRYKQIGKAKRFFVLAVVCFSVEAFSTVTIHFMETYNVEQRSPQATPAPATAAAPAQRE